MRLILRVGTEGVLSGRSLWAEHRNWQWWTPLLADCTAPGSPSPGSPAELGPYIPHPTPTPALQAQTSLRSSDSGASSTKAAREEIPGLENCVEHLL